MEPSQKCGGFLYLCSMKKLLTHLLILALIRNEKKAQMIVDIIYDVNTPEIKEKVGKIQNGSVKSSAPNNDKKREVMEAIQFLKNKETKTKADRDKIQMLEVILKTV